MIERTLSNTPPGAPNARPESAGHTARGIKEWHARRCVRGEWPGPRSRSHARNARCFARIFPSILEPTSSRGCTHRAPEEHQERAGREERHSDTRARAHTHVNTPRQEARLPRPPRPSPRAVPPGFPFGTRVLPTAHGRTHPHRTTLARVVSRAVVISGRATAFAEGGRRYKQARERQHLAQGTVKREVHSGACLLAGPFTSSLCKRAGKRA